MVAAPEPTTTAEGLQLAEGSLCVPSLACPDMSKGALWVFKISIRSVLTEKSPRDSVTEGKRPNRIQRSATILVALNEVRE